MKVGTKANSIQMDSEYGRFLMASPLNLYVAKLLV
jgi:hypothetical protein